MAFLKLSIDEISSAFNTGFNACCGGYELNKEFSVLDTHMGGCLDASPFVPTGSVKRHKIDDVNYRAVISSCYDMVCSRMGF